MFGRRVPTPSALVAFLLLSPTWSTLALGDESEPLHVKIDRVIDQASLGTASPVAGDAEFLRRVYLDLTGSIPPSDVVRAFLADESPNKRAALVDRLLNSPSYARHLARTFDVMLTERRAEKQVKRQEWEDYLFQAFANNRPWNELAAEILAADGTDERNRVATAFYFYRDGEANLVTRDVGRVFFGMDLQCCQCHDHPLVGDYRQADYYGIFAFVSQGFLFTDKDKKVFFAEKAPGDVTFTSVFTQEKDQTRPRLPEGFELLEPSFSAGDEYVVKPDNKEKQRPIPKFSRREQLAERIAAGGNAAFDRNMANRLWAHMMGRGLVDPVDLHHPDNPPSQPELLNLLADEFAAMDYDVRGFLRELALTQVYQRSLEVVAADAFAGVKVEEILAQCRAADEQLDAELNAKTDALKQGDEQRTAAEANLATASAELSSTRDKLTAAATAYDEVSVKLATAEKERTAKQQLAAVIAEARDKTRIAAETLKDDQQLAQAAALFADRATKLAAAVDMAVQAYDAVQATATAANAARKTAEEQHAAANQKVETSRQAVLDARQQVASLRDEMALLQGRKQQVAARIAVAEQIAEHARLLTAWQAADNQWQAARDQLQSQRQQLTSLQSQLPDLATQLAAARGRRETAASQLSAAETKLTEEQQIAEVTAAAARAAAAASEKLAEDAELKQTAATLQQRSEQAATQVDATTAQVGELKTALQAAEQEATVATQKHQEAQAAATMLAASIEKLAAGETELANQRAEAETALAAFQRDFDAAWAKRFFAVPLAALTPEQMAWSVMQATGQVARQQTAAEAEVDKSLPIDPANPDDPQRRAEREKAIEKYVYDKLKGNEGTFVKLFGHAEGQPQSDFFATVDQALFFANAGTLPSWLSPGGGNLTDRLNQLTEPAEIAEELYVSVLTRPPSPDEVADVANYLNSRPDAKVAALQEMAWALITSAEFRFRH